MQICDIRDGLEYYIDENQQPDFAEDEGLYEDLDFDELSAQIGNSIPATSPPEEDPFTANTPTSTNSSSPSPSPNVANHSKVCIATS